MKMMPPAEAPFDKLKVYDSLPRTPTRWAG